jgi:hypothetical protein
MRLRAALIVLTLAALACGEFVGTPTPTPPAPATSPPSPTAAATVTPQATGTASADVQTAIVRAALVNVRANPGGEVVGQIEAGQEVEIVGCVDGWCEIAEPAGYVFQGCLSIADGLGCEAK